MIDALISKFMFPGAGRTPTYSDYDQRYQVVRTGDKNEYLCLKVRCETAEPRGVFVLFHGNMSDAGRYLGYAYTLAEALKMDVILPELPGYGMAPGRALEATAKECAFAMARYARSMNRPIIVAGNSIGTGSASYMAAELTRMGTPAVLLVLVAPFESLQKMVDRYSMRIKTNGFPTAENILTSRCITVCIHGDQDTVVPIYHSIKIVEKTGALLHTLQNKDHELSLEEDVFPLVLPVIEERLSHEIVKNYGM